MTTASALSFSRGRSVVVIVGGTASRVVTRLPSPSVSPRTSPLHDRHVAAGAKLADFSGWSMPIEYAGGGGPPGPPPAGDRVGPFAVFPLGGATPPRPGAAALVGSRPTNHLSPIGPRPARDPPWRP